VADQKWYDEGLRPRVLINWQSFVDQGIQSDWQGPFTDAVINAYTRWMNVAGVDLRFQFWGYTTKTESDSGELVISMNERHANSTRLASTFGTYNKLIIVFHRKRGSDLTPWPFVPHNAAAGEFDMQAILTHELGHCLGLDHSTGANDTMNGSYEYHRQRFGPFANDVARARNVYSLFTRNRLRELRSQDGGASWAEVTNDLTPYGHVDARTNITPGVANTPGSGFYVVGWTLVGGPPRRGCGETASVSSFGTGCSMAENAPSTDLHMRATTTTLCSGPG
jgi:Matrixin